MNPNAPSTMFGAWVLAPAILALSAIGWGGLVELAVGRQIPGLRFPLGLAAMTIALSGPIILGVSATAVVVIAAVLAFIGIIAVIAGYRGRVRDDRSASRERGWIAFTGFFAFAVMMAPLVGSGRAGILGYVLNNDPAAHLSAVELIRTSGLEYFEDATITFQQVTRLFEDSYPIGSHVLVLYTSVLSGAEGLFIWTPIIALGSAGTAIAIRALLLQFNFPAWACSIGAVVASCTYLAFSFLVQGGLKEILLGMTVMLAVAAAEFSRRESFTARSLIPFAIAAGSALSIFGPAAAFWILPIAAIYLVIALRRPAEGTTRRQLITGFVAVGAGAIVLLAPQLIDAVGFARVQNGGAAVQEFGNLLGPLKWFETLGIWFIGDYRFPIPDHKKINAVLLLLAAAILVVGIAASWRRRLFAPAIALGAGLIACLWLHRSYSPYIEAKGLLVLALAVTLMVVIGVLALSQTFRRTGIVVAIILLLGAGYSTWLVYSSVYMTPKDRFTELAAFNDTLAGKGTVLVNDREAYAKLLLRDTEATDIWSSWIIYTGVLTERGTIDNPPHTPDSDDYANAFRSKFQWILDRKHPGSRPPGNYALVQDSEHYRLWQRVGPAPEQHIPLGYDVVGGAVPLECKKGPVADLIRQHPKSKVRIAISPETVKREMVRGRPGTVLPPNFEPGPQAGIFLRKNLSSTSAETVELVPGTQYNVFVQGSFGPGYMHWVNGRSTGSARQDLGTQDGWQPFGTFVAGAQPTTVLLTAESKPAWQAGSQHGDLVGQTAFVPTAGERLVVTTGRGLKKYCGYNVDWVERL